MIKLIALADTQYLDYMSENQAQPSEDELPIKKYLESSRLLITKVKGFEFKKMIEGLIVFLSIILAYFVLEVTHQHPSYFEDLTRTKLSHPKTTALMFFLFSLYLIFWNLVARVAKNRAMQPPPKGDEYEQVPQEEPALPATLPPLPNGQKYYHEIIEHNLSSSIYFFLILVSVLSYAYFSQPRRPNLPTLVSVQRVNYLCVWFLAANLLTLLGDLLYRVTQIRAFRVLGVATKLLVGALALGLANGLNTFIFI